MKYTHESPQRFIPEVGELFTTMIYPDGAYIRIADKDGAEWYRGRHLHASIPDLIFALDLSTGRIDSFGLTAVFILYDYELKLSKRCCCK